MGIKDLRLGELLELEPHKGVIRFAGERAVLLNAVALGLLRKELIDTFGVTAARAVLTRFGYAQGWRTAQSVRTEVDWKGDEEWERAGGQLHTLLGLHTLEPQPGGQRGSTWRESFEAEQHLLHLGRSEQPVCWILTGLASGYLSCARGKPVYVLEQSCIGRGDAVCKVLGQTREQWGEAYAEQLRFFHHQELDGLLNRVAERLKKTEQALRRRQRQLEQQSGARVYGAGLTVQSEALRRVVEVASRVARVDSTVLLLGESGVGKERIAQLIHAESSRANGPFVPVNCGAVAESLLESELFGHVRGAFTGASQERIGLFEAAQGGTLFLDEVGELSAAMQVKLLRALQERQIRRVGENRTRAVDVRLLAATNQELAEAVRRKQFRADLYYRLKVVELRIPPLRERKEDILPLARVMLAEAARRARREPMSLSPKAAAQLLRHTWPGNVRELQNAMEHAVALAPEPRIQAEDLPEELHLASPGPWVNGALRPLEEMEREYILAVLRAHGGNRTHAARTLGIGAATLFRKLRHYQVPPHPQRPHGRARRPSLT